MFANSLTGDRIGALQECSSTAASPRRSATWPRLAGTDRWRGRPQGRGEDALDGAVGGGTDEQSVATCDFESPLHTVLVGQVEHLLGDKQPEHSVHQQQFTRSSLNRPGERLGKSKSTYIASPRR
jgi:hypothetical protein